ncbi:MAG TPA: hypothetical protein VF624_16000 [Tepidisphaeraceae bacterium]|jgi:chromosome segregation ATPase
MQIRAFSVVLGLVAVLSGGCTRSDPALARSQRAVAVLIETRRSLAESEKIVSDSQAALRQLQESDYDLRAAFKGLERQIARVRVEADRTHVAAESVRGAARGYSDARASDVKTIQNEELRQAAQERTADVVARYERINALYVQVVKSFTAYVRDLDDLHTFLANDLNHPALQSATRWLDEAQSSGEALRDTIRALSAEVHTTSNVLSPTPVPATEWNTADTTQPVPAGYLRSGG